MLSEREQMEPSEHGFSWGEFMSTVSPQLVGQVWLPSYGPYRDWVVQLTSSGRRVHTMFCAGDVHGWWEEMFGWHTAPLKGVWYEVKGYDREGVTLILFDAFSYAERLFQRSGIDPRQQPFIPKNLPDIVPLLDRKGDRCELCFNDWSEDYVPESPLLHEYETCCRHFACKACWLSLQRQRCPWCSWSVTPLLREIAADAVSPGLQAPSITNGPDTGDVCGGVHVGYLYAVWSELMQHFEHNPCDDSGVFCAFDLDGHGVWLINGTFQDEQQDGTWGVVCAERSADIVLSGLACLFAKVTKLYTFSKDTRCI